ncbi:MAG: 50S ribosomal protein L23 [Betaproteobacteria bacterium]
MMDARDIIRRPLVTEKSTGLIGERNQYTFEVAPGANKTEIRRAVEEIFKVKVLAVNTVRVPGKLKRQGRFVGKTPDVRKAVVTVRPGDRIEVFEGV